MKKILAALLACALMLSMLACAETLTSTDRSITLPEGYVLGSASAGTDVVLDAAGNSVMEIRNTGYVGGDHSQLAPKMADADAQFASELNAAGYTEGYEFGMRQYAGQLFLAAFAQKTSGEPAARIATIDEAGNLIDVWSFLDKATTEQMLNSLGPGNPIGELPQQSGRKASKTVGGERIGQNGQNIQNPTGAAENTAAALPTLAPLTQTETAPVMPLQGDIMSMTRIHEELGVFNFNELTNVKGVEHSAAAQMQVYRVNLEEEVYVGGSEGYWEEWRTSNGILSEIQFDWDQDGAAEYVVLYVKEEAGEYDVEQNMYLAVYESAGTGWIRADECIVMNHRGVQERYVRLLWGDKPRFAVGSNMGTDGAVTFVRNSIYSYNGQKIVLDAVSEGASHSFMPSYVAEGAMDPDEIRALQQNLDGVDFVNALAGQQVILASPIDGGDEFGHAEYIEQVADALAKYGLSISVTQHDEYYCEISVDGGDIFWYTKEIFANGESYVDVKLFSEIDHGFGGEVAAPRNETAAETAQTAETEAAPNQVLVLTDVNVRSGPGTNYDKIGSARTGSTYTYLGESETDGSGNQWLKISFSGSEGWVSANYAELVYN